MMVPFVLANRFPQLLWWGPDYICIYNDAYVPVLGAKHPWAMGKPMRECWSEVWDVLRPLIDTPFNGGPATWIEDIELEVRATASSRRVISPSPTARCRTNPRPRGIGGVLATVHEITQKVIGERRVGILRDLGARVAEIAHRRRGLHVGRQHPGAASRRTCPSPCSIYWMRTAAI